jgi:hypothetical protein
MATNKQFSMGKNGPNSPDFEKKKEGFQIAKF